MEEVLEGDKKRDKIIIEIEKRERRINWLRELFYHFIQQIDLEIAESESYVPKEEYEQLKFRPIRSGTAWEQK